jgi:hypothetical protein
MLDENTFGLLISYHSLEEDEYAGERADFIERYSAFASLLRARLTDQPPGAPARAVDLGHALYVELLDDAEHGDLIAWLRGVRTALGEHGYRTAAILSFGAAWIDEAEPRPDSVDCGALKLTRVSLPSEPLVWLAGRCGMWRLPVVFLLSVAACAVLYEVVEKPARRAVVARWRGTAGAARG